MSYIGKKVLSTIIILCSLFIFGCSNEKVESSEDSSGLEQTQDVEQVKKEDDEQKEVVLDGDGNIVSDVDRFSNTCDYIETCANKSNDNMITTVEGDYTNKDVHLIVTYSDAPDCSDFSEVQLMAVANSYNLYYKDVDEYLGTIQERFKKNTFEVSVSVDCKDTNGNIFYTRKLED